MAKAELLDALDRLVVESRDGIVACVEQDQWLSAFNATINGLIYRVIALAVRLDVVPPSIHPTANLRALAIDLKRHCVNELERGGADTEAQQRSDKIAVVVEVIDSIVAVVTLFEGGAWKKSDGALALVFASGNLGRVDVMLGFAEEGFWEQIYAWRKSRSGKPPGTLAAWKYHAAPVIQSWIDADSTIKTTTLINKLYQWLEEQSQSRDWETAKSAIRQMQKAGLISIPDRKKVNKPSRT